MSRLTKFDYALMELRGQLIVLTVVFLGGLVLAIVMATQRPWFESFVREKSSAGYASYPEPLRRAVDALAEDKLAQVDFEKLGPDQRRQLYEDWIERSDVPRLKVPQKLTRWAPLYYLQCAEKTVVCGSPDQQKRAVQFLQLCSCREATEVLTRLAQWADTRQLVELRASLGVPIE
jgi:hypothetical protein